MQEFILERGSKAVFGYRVFNSDITTQMFFIKTRMGCTETNPSRSVLYSKFKRLVQVHETKSGVRAIGDELR